jgi:hypothetical protein
VEKKTVKIVIIAENKAQQDALAAEFGAAIKRGSTGIETPGAPHQQR